VQHLKSLIEQSGLSLKRYIKILNIATGVLISIYALFFFSATAVACHQNSFSEAMSTADTWIFTLLAVVFFGTGLWMIQLLRKHFPSLYQEIGCKIWIATFCLTIPLFLRGLNSWLNHRHGKYLNYYKNHFAFVNSVYILLSSLLPIVTQMSSLLFGS